MKRMISLLMLMCLVCTGVCFAGEATYINIMPSGKFVYTELGYRVPDGAHFDWWADADIYGYTYVVQDMYGFDVPGYGDPVISQNNGIIINAADFELDKVYTLTVYAFDSEDDTDPICATEWFVLPSDLNSESETSERKDHTTNIVEETEEILDDLPQSSSLNDSQTAAQSDRKDVYNSYFDAHFAGDTPVVLADVTGDGQDEMIILNNNDGFTAGSVLTVDSSGEVQVIYQNFLPHSHGGVCGWYLIPQADGGYALLEESDELWQGIGTLYFTEFRLTETGEMVQLRNLWLSSDEPGCVDANGMLEEFLIDDYAMQLGDIISTGTSLFVYGSMSSAFVPAEDMSYDGAFMGYSDAAASGANIARDGLVSMLSMEYMEIYFALTDMAWYDSFDNPGIWILTGNYAGGSVSLQYYAQPDTPGAYPYVLRVTDTYGDMYLPVTSELITGMTWAQVQQLYWESLGDIEQYDGYAIAYGYPEQGCAMTLMFDEASDSGKLISVTVEYFE